MSSNFLNVAWRWDHPPGENLVSQPLERAEHWRSSSSKNAISSWRLNDDRLSRSPLTVNDYRYGQLKECVFSVAQTLKYSASKRHVRASVVVFLFFDHKTPASIHSEINNPPLRLAMQLVSEISESSSRYLKYGEVRRLRCTECGRTYFSRGLIMTV